MNLSKLNTSAMLAHSRVWMEDTSLRTQLATHPLGAAILEKIAEVHQDLGRKQSERNAAEENLEGLRGDMSALDTEHDSIARVLYHHLLAFIEMEEVNLVNDNGAGGDGADGNAQHRIDALRVLFGRLFPNGLDIVRRSYLEEAGEVVARDQRLTQAERDLMAAIQVGNHTLADLYQRWHHAGSELGRKGHERALLKASLRHQGSATSRAVLREARRQWIRTVTALFEIVELIPLDREAREAVLGPLEESLRDLASLPRNEDSAPEAETEFPDDGAGDVDSDIGSDNAPNDGGGPDGGGPDAGFAAVGD